MCVLGLFFLSLHLISKDLSCRNRQNKLCEIYPLVLSGKLFIYCVLLIIYTKFTVRLLVCRLEEMLN